MNCKLNDQVPLFISITWLLGQVLSRFSLFRLQINKAKFIGFFLYDLNGFFQK